MGDKSKKLNLYDLDEARYFENHHDFFRKKKVLVDKNLNIAYSLVNEC